MKIAPDFQFVSRISVLLIGLFVFFYVLFIGKTIILPILYATIFAILISPAVNFLVNKSINKALSIAIVLSVSLLFLISIIGLVMYQGSLLIDSFPDMVQSLQDLLNQAISWTSGFFKISTKDINVWISHLENELINSSSSTIGITLSSAGILLAMLLLIPVYVFMILYYQPHLIKFTYRLFGDANNGSVSETLMEIKSILQHYLVGLFVQFSIIAVLNSIGLLVLGIEYAILLGLIGALLNIIPYLGNLMAMILFSLIALITKSVEYIFYVIAMYAIIQFIDNNIIVPKLIGSRVKLNALASIFAVMFGAALWGLHGMFLSIPLLAIIKVILDRTELLKAWGFLLGEAVNDSETQT